MSYDIAAWLGDPTTSKAAEDHLQRLHAEQEQLGDASEKTVPHPLLVEWIEAVLLVFPDLTSYEDAEDDSGCPWSDGPLLENVLGDWCYLGMTYDGAEEALPVLITEAEKRGITLFDISENTVVTRSSP